MRPAHRIVSPLIVLLALFIPLTAHAEDLNETLLNAAKEGQTETVQALIAKGADVNAKEKNGWTALIRAAKKGHIDIVKALLEAGADVNAKDKMGGTA